ncbi:MAG: hypothetical protein NZ992_00245 [Candidatus Korarchaeum sp.]|nr:hypothetical protein [Candidatus Korarchaeum sp.]MDW8093373.1 hypothetical protein [Nitrososphaerota archaeon]
MVKERWIQNAVKKPGALRSYVRRKYGAKGFDSRGNIRASVLRELSKRNDTVGKRARLALTLRRMRRGD